MHDQRLRQRGLALELSLTPCFSKVLLRLTQTPNRFSGFYLHSRQTAKSGSHHQHRTDTLQTAKSGSHHQHRTDTLLKRGVNEISLSQLKFAAIKGHHFIEIWDAESMKTGAVILPNIDRLVATLDNQHARQIR